MTTPYCEIDGVTLYLGDCREITEWLSADVLVTDPPYGVAYAAGGMHSDRSVNSRAVPSIVGDADTSVRDAVLAAWGSTRPAVVFGTWRTARPERVTHRLIWHKAARKPGISPHAWFPAEEEIYLIGSGWVGTPRANVITTTEAREREPVRWGHPTPKPVPLMETLIAKCPPGVIADPFAGSGATLVAARNLGRRAIGVEIEERYCEIIAARLAQGCLPLGAAT